MEVAPDVFEPDELGQGVLLCGLDLAAILAQQRVYKVEAESFVDLFFRRTGDHRLALEQAVFIELQPSLDGDLTEADVMGRDGTRLPGYLSAARGEHDSVNGCGVVLK